jgi:hypothetical protein
VVALAVRGLPKQTATLEYPKKDSHRSISTKAFLLIRSNNFCASAFIAMGKAPFTLSYLPNIVLFTVRPRETV